jgi:3-methyladenine DNA glycosylase/8-oxoguanine DNA glycosylase
LDPPNDTISILSTGNLLKSKPKKVKKKTRAFISTAWGKYDSTWLHFQIKKPRGMIAF